MNVADLARRTRNIWWLQGPGALAIRLFFALAMLCPGFFTPALAQGFAFSNVQIEGNERVDAATILSYAGIARGTELSAAQLNDAYQRIVASGLFETVEIDPRGSTLVIRVQELPTINVVSFEGNKRLKDELLETLVQSKPRRVYSAAQAEADAAQIALAYEQAGRYAASVRPRIIRRDGNRVDLVFEITEGGVVEIERLGFVGNRAFSDRRLRQVLETKQAGFLRQLISADTFVADRLEFDKQLLRDFYASRGFIDFEVLDAVGEITRERDAFFLTFTIREGQSFRIGNITTISEIAELDAAEFEAVLRLRSGVTYSPSIIDTNITRMENLALKKGLNFVRIEPRITRNDRDLTLDIEFAIVRGERVFVERIDIEGNTTTRDDVIRRQFRTAEGDPFNPREVRRSAERIRALGFFVNADVEAEPGSTPDQVVVNVDVEEQPTGSFGFGVAYGVSTGIGFNINFSETNFLGRGQAFGATINTAEASANGSLTFSEPAFLGRDLRFTTALFYGETNNENARFNTENASFRVALGFPVSENGRLEVRYQLLQDNIFDVAAGSSNILFEEEAEGRLTASSIGYTYAYDTRREGLNPNGGFLLRFGQDFAGLGGDQQFIETNALALVERRVLNEEVMLRAVIEGGALVTNEGFSRVPARYFGNNKIRGFEINGIGPRDRNVPVNDALGGNYFAAVRFEAEFPLGIPEEYGIKGGVFFDAGSVWGLDNTNGGTDGNDPVDDDFYLRTSIGASIFWDTPVGPLRFDFAQAIRKQSYDQEQFFDFTISTQF